MEAEFATPEITLTDPNYRLRFSKFEHKFNFHEIFLKKSQKTSYLENCKVLSSHIWRQNSQLLNPGKASLQMVNSNFEKFFISKFSKTF